MPNQPRTGTELAALEAALDQLTSRRELTYRCAAWFVGGTDVLDKLIANGADDETVIEYWRKRQEETDAVVNGYLREENADLRAQLAKRDEDDEDKFLAFREGLGVEIYLCGGAGTADGWRELGQFAAKLLAKHERQRIERAARVSADASKERKDA